jgi:hypothetical protein
MRKRGACPIYIFVIVKVPEPEQPVPFIVHLPEMPLSLNDPLAVSPETKHGELLVKVKFEMLSDPSPLAINDVPKLKAVTLFESMSVAFQVPLRLAGVELFEPQPTRINPTASNTATANCFMNISLFEVAKGRN